jgi:hypothetical protein
MITRMKLDMTFREYRAALRQLGMTQARAAKFFALDPRTSRRFATGESPVPRPIALCLWLLTGALAGTPDGLAGFETEPGSAASAKTAENDAKSVDGSAS